MEGYRDDVRACVLCANAWENCVSVLFPPFFLYIDRANAILYSFFFFFLSSLKDRALWKTISCCDRWARNVRHSLNYKIKKFKVSEMQKCVCVYFIHMYILLFLLSAVARKLSTDLSASSSSSITRSLTVIKRRHQTVLLGVLMTKRATNTSPRR